MKHIIGSIGWAIVWVIVFLVVLFGVLTLGGVLGLALQHPGLSLGAVVVVLVILILLSGRKRHGA